MPKELLDGTSDWSGGMDTSRAPFFIDPNQYAIGINVELPESLGGIKTRPGYRHIDILFNTDKEENIYRLGNIQGEGYYFDGREYHLLRSVDGWIFKFSFINNFIVKGKIINPDNQNNPNNLQCWFNQIPFGCIISDGESRPFYLYRNKIRRTKGREIGACLMGVYVQNRFFYVKPDRISILASTINEPISLEEAYIDNIYGFISPENGDPITAITRNKTILRDALGGNLSWSTSRNCYSVDVKGARTGWGRLAGQGTGFVENTVTDVGACSSTSYEPFNGNIYFRNANYGLSSTKLAQYQFINLDSYYCHSIEANLFFRQDNECMLHKCYTRGHKSKIYTTIAPEFRNNFIIWNGLIVYAPDIYYTSETKAKRRYEGVYTGIRPWCVTVLEDFSTGSKMFIDSHDYDGVNRLYLLDHTLDHDTNGSNERVDIESKIWTRGYGFKDDFSTKKSTYVGYQLSEINSDTKVCIETRTKERGKFQRLYANTHRVTQCCMEQNKDKEKCFKPIPIHPESRDVNCSIDQDEFSVRQDLIKITGSATLRKHLRTATVQDFNRSVTGKESAVKPPNVYAEERFYTYKTSK